MEVEKRMRFLVVSPDKFFSGNVVAPLAGARISTHPLWTQSGDYVARL